MSLKRSISITSAATGFLRSNATVCKFGEPITIEDAGQAVVFQEIQRLRAGVPQLEHMAIDAVSGNTAGQQDHCAQDDLGQQKRSLVEDFVVSLIEEDVKNADDHAIPLDRYERFNEVGYVLRRGAFVYFVENRSGDESLGDPVPVNRRWGKGRPPGPEGDISGRVPDPDSIDVADLGGIVEDLRGTRRRRGAGEEGQNIRIPCEEHGNPVAAGILRVLAEHIPQKELTQKHSSQHGESDADRGNRELFAFRIEISNDMTRHWVDQGVGPRSLSSGDSTNLYRFV
jgi:hypothetical protein